MSNVFAERRVDGYTDLHSWGIGMIKTLRLTKLVIAGALFLAGAILWSLGIDLPVAERENAHLSPGSSAYDRARSSPPLAVPRETTEASSFSLHIGDLTEPPPERSVAGTRQNRATDERLNSMITAAANRETGSSPKDDRETSLDVGSPSAGEVGTAIAQAPSLATPDDSEIRGSATSEAGAAKEGLDPPPADRLAARSEGVDADAVSGVESDAAEREASEADALKPDGTGAAKGMEAPEPVTPEANSSQDIVYIEKLLDILGYEPGPVDGTLDPRTEEAVVMFQKENGRETTGKIDDQLVGALENKLFTFLQQYIKTERWQGSDIPGMNKAERPIAAQKAAKAPSDDRPPAQTLAKADSDVPVAPAANEHIKTPAADPVYSQKREERPVALREVREAAIQNQPFPVQRGSERVVENVRETVPNAFEACATSEPQQHYLKTQTGYIPCEEFLFDSRAMR